MGDAGNALAMADMQTTPMIGASTIDAAYTQLVTQVGSDVQQATNQVDTTTALTNALQNQRQSVSGVSLDEEMTNLITFQRGYQASARALSAMDDMLDTADQPHREGRPVTTRITQGMMNQTLLYDLRNVTRSSRRPSSSSRRATS